MSQPRIAIIVYTVYGHISKMAEAVKEGVHAAGGTATIYQIPETLSQEILTIIKAPPKPDYPLIAPEELTKFDGYIFGIPTRYGNFPVQWKSFWDGTGGLWASGALIGKYCGAFVSTGTPGGGQEVTILNTISTYTHHGMIYVPLGVGNAPAFGNLEEVRGGSPWGAGTFAGVDGSRQPTALELSLAKIQGERFYNTLAKVKF